MHSASQAPQAVVVVADAGPDAGLGHISRSSAIAVGLRCRGTEVRCFAHGAAERFERDGVPWTPLTGGALPAHPGGVLVVDSYTLRRDELEAAARSSKLVVMHDHGGVPLGAALVVNPAGPESSPGQPVLAGFEHVALRPRFWGLPRRQLRERVERVLVTTGSGKLELFGQEVAQAVARVLPSATVTLVRGPYAQSSAVAQGVETLDAPDSLLDSLLSADLVVTAGGQTMFEAVATGAPCIALPLVENQRRQVQRLAELGGVCAVQPADAQEGAGAAAELARDPGRRRDLSGKGQQTIDGYGALRVAFQLERLAGGMS